MSTQIVRTLDLKGLSCPLPIVKTAQAAKELASGDLIEALATDPGSVADFKAWCTSDRQRARRADRVRGRVPLRDQEEVRCRDRAVAKTSSRRPPTSTSTSRTGSS